MENAANIKVHISPKALLELKEYLKAKGCELCYTSDCGRLDSAIALHPDVYMCKLGAENESPVYYGDAEKLSAKYPGDVLYNCAVVGRYIICSKYTSPNLTEAAKRYISSMGLTAEIIFVPQGYVKCNLAVIDSSHVITEDEGIYEKLKNLKDLKCLKISPRQVKLDGYPYGFIGGCCGRVDEVFLFNGDLSSHPDFEAIRAFIEESGLSVKWFDGPLTDIGSIISEYI